MTERAITGWAVTIIILAMAGVGTASYGAGWKAGINEATPMPTQTHRLDPSLMVASWYGKAFHGRTTSSGEKFNAQGFTAASRTLPFGTRLLIGLKGKWVETRITDRGPQDPNRDLDLSEGAAEALGMKEAGLAIVSVIELDKDQP